MTKDAPAFDFYPERWLAGVADMSDSDQIAYLRLLCHQWLRDGLPDDMDALSRLAGRKVTAAVLEKFPTAEDGRRRNKRLEVIRSEQRARITKKSQQRRDAANKRWEQEKGEKLCDRNATAMRPHTSRICETDAGTMPTTHHPPPTPLNRASSAGAWPELGEVKSYAPTVMATDECAEKFWNDCEAAGWVNRHGQPINDWKPLFRNFVTAWKANDHRQKQAAGKVSRMPDNTKPGEIPTVHTKLKAIDWRKLPDPETDPKHQPKAP